MQDKYNYITWLHLSYKWNFSSWKRLSNTFQIVRNFAFDQKIHQHLAQTGETIAVFWTLSTLMCTHVGFYRYIFMWQGASARHFIWPSGSSISSFYWHKCLCLFVCV